MLSFIDSDRQVIKWKIKWNKWLLFSFGSIYSTKNSRAKHIHETLKYFKYRNIWWLGWTDFNWNPHSEWDGDSYFSSIYKLKKSCINQSKVELKELYMCWWVTDNGILVVFSASDVRKRKKPVFGSLDSTSHLAISTCLYMSWRILFETGLVFDFVVEYFGKSDLYTWFRPVSNVVRLLCRTQLIEINSTVAGAPKSKVFRRGCMPWLEDWSIVKLVG